MGFPWAEGVFLVHLKYTITQMLVLQVLGNNAHMMKWDISVIRCNPSLKHFEPVIAYKDLKNWADKFKVQLNR